MWGGEKKTKDKKGGESFLVFVEDSQGYLQL